jgi:ABC-type multidrug transport system ATPase subunit
LEDAVLFALNLDSHRDTKVETLSSSGRQRVKCAIGLLSQSPTLILDDPCKSLDYQSKQRFIGHIKKIKEKSIIYATSDPEEAETINDHVLIMKKGESKGSGPVIDLVSAYGKKNTIQVILNSDDGEETAQRISKMF